MSNASEETNEALGCLGLIALFAISVTVSSLMCGITVSYLWSWFMVPLFGLPVLGKAAAVGVAIVVRSVTWHLPRQNKNEEDNVGQMIYAIIGSVMMYGWFLLMGYVVSSWVPQPPPTPPTPAVVEVN